LGFKEYCQFDYYFLNHKPVFHLFKNIPYIVPKATFDFSL